MMVVKKSPETRQKKLADALALAADDPYTVQAVEYMLASLYRAMVEAGGNPRAVSKVRLNEMSALELIVELAPNKIRFLYDMG